MQVPVYANKQSLSCGYFLKTFGVFVMMSFVFCHVYLNLKEFLSQNGGLYVAETAPELQRIEKFG
jgi:hypothetical protein